MASAVDPCTIREISGPSPPMAVSASSIIVFRLSCGIACRPRLVASRRLLMSGGTEVRLRGITSPSLSDRDVSLRGNSVMYCSPTADWLCTCASRSDGILYFEFSDQGVQREREEITERAQRPGGNVQRDHGACSPVCRGVGSWYVITDAQNGAVCRATPPIFMRSRG